MNGNLIYLASPYTHSDKTIQQKRYEGICSVAAKLMTDGFCVFSPIAYGHSVAQYGELPTDWKYWEKFCRTMLSRCQKVIVVMMDGWENSTGVSTEIKIALEMGIEIEYINVEEKNNG